MPPDEPDPRLSEVASALQQPQQPESRDLPRQHRLDGSVADPIDVILTEGAEQQVHEYAQHQHPEHMA